MPKDSSKNHTHSGEEIRFLIGRSAKGTIHAAGQAQELIASSGQSHSRRGECVFNK